MEYRASHARHMIAAELFSDLGNQVVYLALLAELFFQCADSTDNLLFMCLIQQVPTLALGPWVGRLVDRMGPTAGLLLGVLAKLVIVFGLFCLHDRLAVWGIYFLFMAAALVFLISRLAMTPCIIPRERLLRYNALNERVALGAGIVGPVLIGLSIRHMGTGISLCAGMLMYAMSAALILKLPRVRNEAVTPQPDHQGGWSGWMVRAYLAPLTDRRIGSWAMVSMVVIGIGGVLNFGAPVYHRFFFGGDILAWGMVMSGYQAGSCLAAFTLPALAARWRDSTLACVCFSLTGLGFGLLATLPRLPVFVMTMVGFGWGFTFLHMLSESRIQRNCRGSNRGATMAALTSLRGIGLLIGFLAGYTLASLSGILAMMIGGVLASVGGGGMAMKSPAMREKDTCNNP